MLIETCPPKPNIVRKTYDTGINTPGTRRKPLGTYMSRRKNVEVVEREHPIETSVSEQVVEDVVTCE